MLLKDLKTTEFTCSVQMEKDDHPTHKSIQIDCGETTENSDDRKRLVSPTTPDTKVYKARWLMLFLFSLTTLLNGSMFMNLSTVVKIIAPYYEVSEVNIEWLSNMFMIVFIFVSLPSAYIMSRFGVRTILTVAAGCNAVAASIHYAGSSKKGFPFLAVGQLFAAVAYGNILQVPGKLSALWFPPHERGMSTSIGVFMNILGVAIGFVQPPNMIPVTQDEKQVMGGLKRFFLSKLVFSVIAFVATALLYREKPLTPPSVTDDKPELGFLETFNILVKDKYFIIMAQAYGIYFGLFVAVSVVLSPLVVWQNGADTNIQRLIGWMGFTCDIAAIVSCLLIGLYLGRYSHYRGVAIFLNAGSSLLWLIFIMILTKTTFFPGLFVVYSVYGIFGIPYFASGVEQAAEMTYPVPEGISSTVICLLGNLYGFLFIYTLGSLIENGYPLTAAYVILGFYILSTILVCVAKTELKRFKAESAPASQGGYGSEHETHREKFVHIVIKRDRKNRKF